VVVRGGVVVFVVVDLGAFDPEELLDLDAVALDFLVREREAREVGDLGVVEREVFAGQLRDVQPGRDDVQPGRDDVQPGRDDVEPAVEVLADPRSNPCRTSLGDA
jgi:hypothetical protein